MRPTSPLPPEKTPRKKVLLKEQLELDRYKTREGRIRTTIKPIEDQLSFDKGFYVFIRALQLIKQNNEGGILLVGLAGPSGSGKSAFSEKVKDFIPGVAVISMDMYNDSSKLVDGNYDDPRLTDYDLLLRNLEEIKRGQAIEVPIYDFKQSRRVGYKKLEPPTSRIVIVEGIFALSERLRPLEDLRVSITGGVHFDLIKRVIRDISRSGQGPEEIIQQITETVYPMYKAYIEPDLQTAQLKILNAFNPFTGFMNATYILKSGKQVSHEEAEEALGGSVQRKMESEIIDIYLLPPDEDSETCQSWLRMRNRDGKYSLMFEEWVTEAPFIISPRISFEVSVKLMSGLMALGYTIGTLMKRTSLLLDNGEVTIKFDDIANLGGFIQIQGKDRQKVWEISMKLGLKDTFIPKSYIEQVQLSKLTDEFSLANMSEELRGFGAQGQAIMADILGSSPPPLHLSRSLSYAGRGHREDKLSSSAPIPIKHMTSAITQRSSNGNGLLGQQLRHSPTSHDAAAPMQPSTSPLLEGAQRMQSNALASTSAGTNIAQLNRMYDKLDTMSNQVSQYGSVQLQMDAMIYQYKQTNEGLAKLNHTNEKLANLMEQLARSRPEPTSAATLLAAGTLVLGVGLIAGLLLMRR